MREGGPGSGRPRRRNIRHIAETSGPEQGAIVLEDDCVLFRPEQLPLHISELPGDSITLLGGTFRGWEPWRRSHDVWLKSGRFLDVLLDMRRGVHPLPTNEDQGGQASPRAARVRMRWCMAVAYYIPPGFAQRLVDAVLGVQGRNLKVPAAWLWHNNFVRHCMWPPPFGGPRGAKPMRHPSQRAKQRLVLHGTQALGGG